MSFEYLPIRRNEDSNDYPLMETCTLKKNKYNVWQQECHEKWAFFDKEKDNYKYCPFCGKEIEVQP